ncbi:MAG: serine dehydratase, partial [Tetragenococcus halophilus]|nr:serine dehydratase [Tetragenococcus halophilus]
MPTSTKNREPKKKKVINYKSCFDIIGPIMIGPSSSHTAGAIAIGEVANKLFHGKPKKAIIKFYESFAATHKGHGTDYATMSGILGFATNDPRVPNALEIAEKKGIEYEIIEMDGTSPVGHANTSCINLIDDDHEIHVTGISVGGGTIEVKYIEIDGFTLEPQGTLPILLAITTDESLKPELEKKLKENNVKINIITRYAQNDKFLFQFDLDSQPPKALKNELTNYNTK